MSLSPIDLLGSIPKKTAATARVEPRGEIFERRNPVMTA